jgi:peroxiredoxin Q/BCP
MTTTVRTTTGTSFAAASGLGSARTTVAALSRAFACVVAFGALLVLARPAQADDSPAVGAQAPEFRLLDQSGKYQSLGQYKGQWVVLYFYPKDDTPGCTTQACSLRDNIFAFRKAGAQILGISVDDAASKKAFAEKYSLPFPVLADPTKETTKKYGVLTKFMGLVEIARRDTFLIDPNGRIVKHWMKVDPDGHSNLVLAELREQQAKAPPGAEKPQPTQPQAKPAPRVG